MPLNDLQCRQFKPEAKPYRKFDGGGLYLEVKPAGPRTPNGVKVWRWKFRHGGKESRLTLGHYPAMSLKAARRAAVEAQDTLDAGRSPTVERKMQVQTRQQAAGQTFEAVALEYLDSRAPGWSKSYADRVRGSLVANAFPYIGHRPISEIEPRELLRVLKALESAGKVETAHRLRYLCGQVFRLAVADGRAQRDPTPDLRGLIRPTKKQHFPTITDANQIGELIRAMRGYNGKPETAAALYLLPLVFVRPGELRSAEWKDFDLEVGQWAFRTSKTDTDHVVPLAAQAIDCLASLHALTGRGRYLFPGTGNASRPMSENTINGALRRLGYDTKTQITGHGFRAMARTCLAELGWDVNAIERQLAHKAAGPLAGAYDRAQYLAERRRMMQAWADHLDSLAEGGERVVPIKSAVLHT